MYITGAQNLRKTSRTELLHMPISERIKTVRGSLSRAAFAKKIKITESTLRNYESGLSLPNSDTIAIVCETCDTDPEWLILGTGSMHPNDTSAVQQHATTQSESTASEPCVRCAKLEKELEEERGERRELAAENRKFWKENGELREKCARLEERMDKPLTSRGPAEMGNLG